MDRVCPLLGLAGDRRVAVDGVDGGHRCYAEEPAITLERPVQAQLCLTAAHERCERFLQFAARAGSADPGRSKVADGFVTTRLLLAPQPAWRGIAGRARASRTASWVVAGAGIAVLGMAGAALAGPLLNEPAPEVATRATASPSVTPIATPRPTPTLTPTLTPSPSATPQPTPTPAPTATPAPTPAPQQTYVVVEGDTLAGIADRFGTTVSALQEANDIEDPNEITIGQVLVIP